MFSIPKLHIHELLKLEEAPLTSNLIDWLTVT